MSGDSWARDSAGGMRSRDMLTRGHIGIHVLAWAMVFEGEGWVAAMGGIDRVGICGGM